MALTRLFLHLLNGQNGLHLCKMIQQSFEIFKNKNIVINQMKGLNAHCLWEKSLDWSNRGLGGVAAVWTVLVLRRRQLKEGCELVLPHCHSQPTLGLSGNCLRTRAEFWVDLMHILGGQPSTTLANLGWRTQSCFPHHFGLCSNSNEKHSVPSQIIAQSQK